VVGTTSAGVALGEASGPEVGTAVEGTAGRVDETTTGPEVIGVEVEVVGADVVGTIESAVGAFVETVVGTGGFEAARS